MLGFVGAVLDIFGLAIIYPFMEVIFDTKTQILPDFFVEWLGDFAIETQYGTEKVLGAVLILFTVLVFLTKSMLLKIQLNIGHELGVYLSEAVLSRKLFGTYEKFSSEERSDLTATITARINNAVYNVIIPLSLILTSATFLVMVGGVVIYVSPPIVILFFLMGLSIYAVLYAFSNSKLSGASLIINENAELKMRAMNELFNSSRLIFLYGRAKNYIKNYKFIDRQVRVQQALIQYEGLSSKFKIEAIVLICAVVALVASESEERAAESLLVNITMFLMVAQRVIPYFQQLYNNLTLIRGNLKDFEQVLAVLGSEPTRLEASDAMVADGGSWKTIREISLHDVAYSYGDPSAQALKQVDLSICSGDKVGIVGKSGAGKTTLLNVLASLFTPSGGSIKINGEPLTESVLLSFRRRISLVTQQVALVHGSLRDNVTQYADGAFDRELYDKCLYLSGLSSGVGTTSLLGDDKVIDEDSVKVSGGQRQRIAIAQALYRQPELLILDEATSGLDLKTQDEVISRLFAIDSLTIVLVTHRQEPLIFCNKVYRLENGVIDIVS